jgi:hypothetical protein
MNEQDQKKHDALHEQLKEACGQKGQPVIIGWSIKDCEENSTTAPIIEKMLELRNKK